MFVVGCEYYSDACEHVINNVKQNGRSAVEIQLKHNPQNLYDENAVAVFAKTYSSGFIFKSSRNEQIGHLSRITAASMARFRKKGASYSATLETAKFSNEEYPFNIKLNIFSDYKG